MASYTFIKKGQVAEPGQLSNFGGMVNDGNRNTMLMGAGPSTSDATGTPQTSPLTVSNSAVTALLVPANAVQLVITAITNTINISEADPTVAANYFTLPTGLVLTIDVARCSTLYLKANTGAATVSFYFNVV
jgi:hypothetical protein